MPDVFSCSARQPIGSPLSLSVIDTIESLFGNATLRRIAHAMRAPWSATGSPARQP